MAAPLADGTVPPPDWLMSMLPHQRLFVLYDRTDMLYHERILCEHVDEWAWVVVTPDLGVHVENFLDVEEIVRVAPRGGVPRSLLRQRSTTSQAKLLFLIYCG